MGGDREIARAGQRRTTPSRGPHGLLAIWLRLAVARALLTVALTCQDRFDSLLLTWFQIESVPLNFLNNFLLQNLALEAPQRVLQSFTILNVDLGQRSPPYSSHK